MTATLEDVISTNNEIATLARQLLLGRVLAATRTFDVSTTIADPGAGKFRLNHATFASITKIALSNTDINGVDLAGEIAAMDDSTSTLKGVYWLVGAAAAGLVRTFGVSAVTLHTGWAEIDVSPRSSDGSAWADGSVFGAAFYPKGDKGEAGANGSDGSDGANGSDGSDGADGKTVLSGAGAPSSGIGSDGDFYVDVSATAIYGPKTSGAWGSPTSLIGPTGATGDTGAAGPEAWAEPAPWLTATAYTAAPPRDVVTINGSTYVCLEAHTSDVFATDLAAGKWLLIAQKGADGLGAGDMVGANNLSDVTNPATARANIGAGTYSLADNTLATARLAFTAAARLAGRVTSGAGAGEEIALGASLELSGSSLQRAALTGDVTAAANSNATTIAAGAVTIAKLAAAAAPGKTMMAVPAGALVANTTNGPASGTTETATNKVMIATLDFDAASLERAQLTIPMPKSWDGGTITARFRWTAASGSGAVVWGIAAVAMSDDDALDAAFGAAQTVTDTLLSAGDLHTTLETAAVTIAGSPADGDLVCFRVYRDAANGSDTLAADAKLIAVDLFITFDAANDA